MELLLLLGHTANATITPESQQAVLETRNIGTSQCINAAGTKLPQAQLKSWGNTFFLCHPSDTDKEWGHAMWVVLPGRAAHAHV